MAYNYLLELYETIEHRRREALAGLEGSEPQRHRGRVDALAELEQFLRANYHARLPRRIRAASGSSQPSAPRLGALEDEAHDHRPLSLD